MSKESGYEEGKRTHLMAQWKQYVQWTNNGEIKPFEISERI